MATDVDDDDEDDEHDVKNPMLFTTLIDEMFKKRMLFTTLFGEMFGNQWFITSQMIWRSPLRLSTPPLGGQHFVLVCLSASLPCYLFF